MLFAYVRTVPAAVPCQVAVSVEINNNKKTLAAGETGILTKQIRILPYGRTEPATVGVDAASHANIACPYCVRVCRIIRVVRRTRVHVYVCFHIIFTWLFAHSLMRYAQIYECRRLLADNKKIHK